MFLVDDGPVKVLDFGIAKVAGVELTRDGAALGTIAYMSPEQIRGDAIDGRTDIWALGVVLFEMCSGELPFVGVDHVTIMHGILELDAPTLDQMIPGFPPSLAQTVARCLEKDPDDRFGDASELISNLDRPGATGAEGAGTDQDEARAPGPSLSEEGERRQATVLSARLAGRGAIEEALSPAEVDALIGECDEAMVEIVAEFGGVANRHTGGTLEALFGIPASEEDDAIRAVRAGAALCERVGAILSAAAGAEGAGLRCGVDTGRVVARTDDTGGSAYRVVGEATELAARLAGQARTGEVVISDSCRRTIGPFFESVEAGSLRRDGDEVTDTFRVLRETGVRSRLEAAAEAQGLSALTGREGELETLLRACRSAEGGQGRFVSIVGDVGVGKSRLLLEFDERIDRGKFDVFRGRCQSFGADIPYLPFVDALRDRLELSELQGPADPAAIADAVQRVSPELTDFTPFYLQLLAVSEVEDPDALRLTGQDGLAREQHRVGLVESLSALFTLAARERPTIALLEDWHWVDTASRQVLNQLLEMVSAFPLMIVVTARPQGDLGWGTPSEHTPIVLAPLTAEESGEIIRSTLGADEVPAALTRLIHDRTGGNPFFLEEVCRALQEEGTLLVETGRVRVAGPLDNLELPDTVQGVLRTRLDRLDGATRNLVRYASVIGREFSRDVLEHALGAGTDVTDDLDRLRHLGLIQQVRVVPTPEYRFKHALTQEVAYDGLLERQREETHGAVAEALEALRPERLDDYLDRLADHFAHAKRWEKAVDYAVAATDRLWSFSEFGEAAETQEKALEWVSNFADEETRFERRNELLLRQERLKEYLGQRDRQQELIDELLDRLDPELHASQIAMVYVRQGDLSILTREHEAAEVALERALALTREIGDTGVEMHALRSFGLLRWHQQRLTEAVDLVESALELDRGMDNREGVIGNLANLGSLHRALGESEKALEYLHEALDAERSMDRRGAGGTVKESYILHTIGVIHSQLGDNEKGLDYLERARASLENRSTVFNVVQMHFHLTAIARLYVDEGRMDEALSLYEEAIDLCRQARHLEGLTTTLRVRGEVLLNLRRYEEALSDLEEAADLYAPMHDLPSLLRMWRGAAVAREAMGDAAALAAWRRTRGLADDLGQTETLLEAAEGIGRLLRHDDPAAARKSYQEALELTLTDGDRARIGGLRYTIGILQWESRELDGALESFVEAFEDLIEGGDSLHAGLALNSIGRTLRDLGRLDEATERLEQSVELNRENDEPLLVAHALVTLGDVKIDAGDPEAAVERFNSALEIRRDLADEPGQGWTLLSLAKAHLARGSEEGASYYLAEAGEVASRTANLELRSECDSLRGRLSELNPEA
ncbi:MAG: tetratricopeptide repeat protein [Gemmatimonadota bacterium]|nr:tetratricopeptide repeat protein [Gemmatimonadota bacterium]